MLVSLNPIKERVSESIREAGFGATELYGQAVDLYQSRPKLRAAVHSLTILLAIYLADSLSGHLLALRMMYIAPIWFAAQRGGRRVGLFVVLTTAFVLTSLDEMAYAQSGSMILQFLLRAGIMTGLMLLIESQETRLKNYVDLATTDPLTGAGNRLSMQKYAHRAIERTARSKDPVTFVVIDCDNFKILNDRFGHAYGDHVLKALARLLRRGVGTAGHVARLGGDEFVVIVPGKRPDDVSRILRRASDRLEVATSILDASPTFSYGVSVAWSGTERLEDLLERADRDMYVRKMAKKGDAYVVTELQPIAS